MKKCLHLILMMIFASFVISNAAYEGKVLQEGEGELGFEEKRAFEVKKISPVERKHESEKELQQIKAKEQKDDPLARTLIMIFDDGEIVHPKKNSAMTNRLIVALLQEAGPILTTGFLLSHIFTQSGNHSFETQAIVAHFLRKFDSNQWVIRQVLVDSENLFLLIPKSYLRKILALKYNIKIDDKQIENALKGFFEKFSSNEITASEELLGFKINHMPTASREYKGIDGKAVVVPISSEDSSGIQNYFQEKYEQYKKTAASKGYIKNFLKALDTNVLFVPIRKKKPEESTNLHWAINLAGHGGYNSSIAGFSIIKEVLEESDGKEEKGNKERSQFQQFLDFLEKRINTRLFMYGSCYAAGFNAKRVYGELTSQVKVDTYPFTIITRATTDALTYGKGVSYASHPFFMLPVLVGAPPLLGMIWTYNQYDEFVKGVEKKSINYSDVVSKIVSEAGVQNIPQIRFKNSPLWIPLSKNIEESVVLITKKMAAMREKNFTIDLSGGNRVSDLGVKYKTVLKDPRAILVYPYRVDFPIVVKADAGWFSSAKTAPFVSMAPGEAVHEFYEIRFDLGRALDLKSDAKTFFTGPEYGPRKIFYVEKVVDESSKNREYKNLVIDLRKDKEVNIFVTEKKKGKDEAETLAGTADPDYYQHYVEYKSKFGKELTAEEEKRKGIQLLEKRVAKRAMGGLGSEKSESKEEKEKSQEEKEALESLRGCLELCKDKKADLPRHAKFSVMFYRKSGSIEAKIGAPIENFEMGIEPLPVRSALRAHKTYKGILTMYYRYFLTSVRWNAFESIVFHIVLLIHQVALFYVVPVETYGKIGTLFSGVYFTVSLINSGLNESLGPFLQEWSECKAAARRFFIRHLIPNGIMTVGLLITLSIIYFSSETAPLFSPALIAITVGLVLSESIKKTVKHLLQIVFKVHVTALVEISTIITYVTLIWTIRAFGYSIDCLHIFSAMLFTSTASCLFLLHTAYQWYKTMPDIQPDTERRVCPVSPRSAIATRMFIYSNDISRQLFSSNFLVPFFAVTFGFSTAGALKMVSTIIYTITIMLHKIFGASSSAFFAHIKTFTAQKKQALLVYATHYLYSVLYTVIFLVFICTIVGNKLCCQGIATSYSLPLSMIIPYFILSFVETFAIIHEKFLINEQKAHFLCGINIFSLLCMYLVLHNNSYFSAVALLIIIAAIRIVSTVLLKIVSLHLWGRRPSLASNILNIFGLVFGTVTLALIAYSKLF